MDQGLSLEAIQQKLEKKRLVRRRLSFFAGRLLRMVAGYAAFSLLSMLILPVSDILCTTILSVTGIDPYGCGVILAVCAVTLPTAGFFLGRVIRGTGRLWGDGLIVALLAALVAAVIMWTPLSGYAGLPILGLAACILDSLVIGVVGTVVIGLAFVACMLLGLSRGWRHDQSRPDYVAPQPRQRL